MDEFALWSRIRAGRPERPRVPSTEEEEETEEGEAAKTRPEPERTTPPAAMGATAYPVAERSSFASSAQDGKGRPKKRRRQNRGVRHGYDTKHAQIGRR